MLLAQVGDTPYNIVLFLHIVLVIVGLAPAVMDPIIASAWGDDRDALRKFAGTAAELNRKIFGNALIVAGLLGFALSGMSDDRYKMSQTWLWLGAIVWIAMIGLLHAVLIPGAKALAAGDDSAGDRLQKFGPIFTVLTLVMLYLMIFKPGF